MKFKTEAERRKYEDAKLAYDALMKFYPLSLDDLQGEVWKTIPNFPNYEGSNFGRVKSFKSGQGKILKPQLGSRGYLHVRLCRAGEKPKDFSVHQIVAQLFIPNTENKREVNHQDGHKMNCFVGNLVWNSSSENHRHAFATGLSAQGIEHVQAKIKDGKIIIYIRENPDNLSLEQLAEMFGVGKNTISDIQRGKTYKNCGGTVRKAQKRSPNVSEEQRAEIRRRYKKGVRGCGCEALAKIFGYSAATIRNIVKEGD